MDTQLHDWLLRRKQDQDQAVPSQHQMQRANESTRGVVRCHRWSITGLWLPVVLMFLFVGVAGLFVAVDYDYDDDDNGGFTGAFMVFWKQHHVLGSWSVLVTLFVGVSVLHRVVDNHNVVVMKKSPGHS